MDRGTPWRLLLTWDAPPGFNMALDEALLRGLDPRPTLRLYTWRPAAVSLGYFQRFDDVAAALRARGAAPPPLVRRMTGGGAIHHAGELTFAVATSLDDPLYRGPIADSYGRVHAVVARALAARGADARARGDARLRSDDAASPMCFHGSAAVDLAWDGRKGVGSAQRRTGGRVLHHGSIKLRSTPLEDGIATLAGTTPQELARELVAAFEAELGLALAEEPPREDELLAARAREGWFTGEAFLRRR